ncbi:GNAT family N-acetyltransferase [Blastococcus sp. DSM 46786]|uniref:GNAT family N-acetyltransferase n=1 Tax=Blastococcus sp. DSM 46786 TaxID=1798227 RepID=UPI001FCCF37A|nr:GNAT family N-acetyltransferase [Blastococcus sp. DSM 46786]
MTAAATTRVAELERLAARTWRGLEEEPYGDWLLRAGGGFTGRANSVLVTGDPPEGLRAAVAAVTAWYADRGLRACAAVPTPGGEAADAAFAAAGWTRDEDTLVLVGPADPWPGADDPVLLDDAPDEVWLAGYRHRGAALPAVAAAVLRHAERPLFASVRPDPATDRPAAVARGVVSDGCLVVSAVTVDEPYRRRGLATAVMAALATEARTRGATSCLLQVTASNTPALALYARLGFTEHHRYHYRWAPPS